MQEEKNNYRLRQLEKYFVPAGIDAKLILQAFKIQENRRMLASCRTKQFGIEQKIEEQVSKLDLLQITGRQSHIPDPIRRVSHKKGIKDIKLVFDNPINRIVEVIAQDPDSKHYQRELSELQRFSSSSSPKQAGQSRELSHLKGIFSHKQLDIPHFGKLPKHQSQQSPNQQSMEYYEQLILNNPVLYRKIMMAYNASKRELDRHHQQNRNTMQKRESAYETKASFRPNLTQITKNAEAKKSSCFSQMREFQLAISLTNKTLIYPQPEIQYKAFICKGNNGLLVKSILKTRPWWSLRSYSEIDSCNLVWTEWKKSKVINRLELRASRSGAACLKVFDLAPPSKKRELALLAEKKASYFRRVVGCEDQLWQKYEKIPQFDHFLKFSSKISDPKFEQSAKQVFHPPQYSHSVVEKESKAHNHIPGCLQLHSKKLLFLNLKNHYERVGKDLSAVLPLTFHITAPDDPQLDRFGSYFEAEAAKSKGKSHNIWICKPGENSNRGNGISVLNNLAEIRNLVTQKCTSGRTLIIQKYFQNPFLFNKRKFDIRCYVLITTVNGVVKGYWYEEGYIRTASKEFSLKNLENKFIHLTNDAIQKKGEEYGKFENYNKVSYSDFEKYLQTCYQDTQQPFNFAATLNQMKEIATDLILSTARKLNPKRKQFCFEIFGLDFMLDDRLTPFLIEANSNPCIEVDGSVLGKVIPAMLQNAIRVAIDPIFPPPYSEATKNRYMVSNLFQTNKMALVYDSYFSDFAGGQSEQKEGEVGEVGEVEEEEEEVEVE